MDVVMCGIYHSALLPLAKTLCFCLLFGVVPEHLYRGYRKGGDLHDYVLSRLSQGKSRFVDALVKPCFDCGVNTDALSIQLQAVPFDTYYTRYVMQQ